MSGEKGLFLAQLSLLKSKWLRMSMWYQWNDCDKTSILKPNSILCTFFPINRNLCAQCFRWKMQKFLDPENHNKLPQFNRSPFFLGSVYEPLLISDLNPSSRGKKGRKKAYLCFKTLRRWRYSQKCLNQSGINSEVSIGCRRRLCSRWWSQLSPQSNFTFAQLNATQRFSGQPLIFVWNYCTDVVI